MKIYTKTGDKGMTKLVDGSCVEKFNPRVEAYGCVDELNSHLGFLRTLLPKQTPYTDLDQHLEIIQNQLFAVGSLLATAETAVFQKLPQITEAHTRQLESWIDSYSEPLPPLKNFILPSGSPSGAYTHICRTACRRAERRSSEIYTNENHYQHVLIYLNRLSDLLFTWARWLNLNEKYTETIWKKENV